MNIVVVASQHRETFVSLQKMLGEEFDLQFAERLPQVFEALAKRPTDLVFIDARLADCEGQDAIREIASAFPDASIVYLAPAEDGRGAAISEKEGIYASLQKPLTREMVRFLAKKAIEKRKLSRRIEYLTSYAERNSAESSPGAGGRVPGEYRGGTSPFLEKGMLRKLLRAVSPVTNVNRLLGRFADSVRELFGSNSVAVFSWDSVRGKYVTGAWQGVDEGLAEVCSFSNKHGMVRWLIEHQQLLTRDKLGRAFAHDIAVELSMDMDALKAEVVMPLLERGSLIGFLTLGRKMTGTRYDEEDLDLLALIGDCASEAISASLTHRGLLVQKDRLEAILNNIGCGIVAVDTEARIIWMNYFAEGALEVSADNLTGKGVQKLGSVLADMVLRTIREDQTFVSRRYRDKTTGRVLCMSTSRMCDEKSKLVGAILFFTVLPELTTSTTAETQLPEDETFAAFCAHIADRIKNPLASIKTFSQLLPEKFDDTEFRQKFPEVVGKAVERINLLADGLTTYGATGPLDLSPTSIAAVIENTVTALRKSLNRRKLRVIAPGAEKPTMALADGQLIRSAFLNVLRNSVESTPPDGTITISVREVSAKELRKGDELGVVFD
ncbi:GAF domain-containing protein, partial [bacterium]|nr:GAF domain-containing protein [bacterium]